MDYDKVDKAMELSAKHMSLAEQYSVVRAEAGSAQADFDILLAANLEEIRKDRPSIGYEMASLKLVEREEVAKQLYKEWKTKEAWYKGAEKLLDAMNSQLIMTMGIMKREGRGEAYGT